VRGLNKWLDAWESGLGCPMIPGGSGEERQEDILPPNESHFFKSLSIPTAPPVVTTLLTTDDGELVMRSGLVAPESPPPLLLPPFFLSEMSSPSRLRDGEQEVTVGEKAGMASPEPSALMSIPESQSRSG